MSEVTSSLSKITIMLNNTSSYLQKHTSNRSEELPFFQDDFQNEFKTLVYPKENPQHVMVTLYLHPADWRSQSHKSGKSSPGFRAQVAGSGVGQSGLLSCRWWHRRAAGWGVSRATQRECPVPSGPEQNQNFPRWLFKSLRKWHYLNIFKRPLPFAVLFANLVC